MNACRRPAWEGSASSLPASHQRATHEHDEVRLEALTSLARTRTVRAFLLALCAAVTLVPAAWK
jgi:hypothetical protein